MKIIHTSDWHIGRQFHNVSLLDDQRHVLKQLIDYIQQHQIDALIIAGDLYDRSVPPAAAVALLDEVLNTICIDLSVPVIIIPGNHDSAQRLSFGARQLKQTGLHILADLGSITTPVKINKGTESCCFYGIPYNDPEHVRNQFSISASNYEDAQGYLLDLISAEMDPCCANIIISHCFVDGAEPSESERPLSIGGADRISADLFRAFDYAALGHLHQPQYKGAEHIRYSGSLLKYSFSEQHHNKSLTLIELHENQLKSISTLPLKPLHDLRVIEGSMATILQQAGTDPYPNDYLLVRLTDKHAIMDAMGKLRQVYPNILHLEKPGMLTMDGNPMVSREKLKRGELDMFQDFYQQIMGQSMDQPQLAAVEEIIGQLQRDQEGHS